jgi:site-specific recombinase XerD
LKIAVYAEGLNAACHWLTGHPEQRAAQVVDHGHYLRTLFPDGLRPAEITAGIALLEERYPAYALRNLAGGAGVSIGIHQLRHAHATELINSGVSIEAVRRRLGHASTETTQIYTLLADKIADDEIRAACRRRDTRALTSAPKRHH